MVRRACMFVVVLCAAISAGAPVAATVASPPMSTAGAESAVRVRQIAAADFVPATFPGRNGRIAFVHAVKPGPFGGRRDVFTVRRDGTGVQRLTFRRSHGLVRWAPSGRRILYDAGNGISVMDARGKNKQHIIRGYGGDWAPHGGRFVFSRYAPAGDRLYVYSFDTGSARPIRTPDGSYVEIFSAAWSPNGHRIAFAHCDCDNDNSLTYDLYTIRPNGKGLRQTTFTPHSNETSPNWSPTGGRLVYDREGEYSNCSHLTTIRADGSASAQRVHVGCKFEAAVWSPNGSKLVAYRYGKPRTGLWIMNVDGSNRRFLVSGDNPDWQPRR